MEATENKEYAGKGIAGTGLGLGIAGTALGLLNGSGGGGNILGGLFGGSNASNELANAKAELAKVNAERYTDQAILAERDRHIGWAERLAAQDANLRNVDEKINDMALKNQQDIAALKDSIVLQNEIDNKNAEIKMLTLKNELSDKINTVASIATQGIQANASGIAGLQATVSNILNMTQLVIPQRNVCNTCCNCNCGSNQ